MVDEGEVIARVDFLLFGIELIDDDVVGLLEGRAFDELEAIFFLVAGCAPGACHSVNGVEVYALDSVKTTDGLDHGAGSEDDAGFFGEDGDGLVAHGSGGEAHRRGAGGPDEDVCADAAGATRAGVEGTVRDAHKRQDHGDFDPDGQDGEKSAERAVDEIGEDKLIDQVFSISDRKKFPVHPEQMSTKLQYGSEGGKSFRSAEALCRVDYFWASLGLRAALFTGMADLAGDCARALSMVV